MASAGKHAREDGSKMKRKILAAAVAAMCCALLAGGTLAYFTASEKAHNVITSGGVSIDLLEWADESRQNEFEDLEGVMPGQSVTKIVEVKNDGQSPAWVRIKAEVSVRAVEGSDAQLSADVVSIEFNKDSWILKDGFWYYGVTLQPGDTTVPLFEKVAFGGPAMGNEYQGSSAVVDVYAQAVQSDNNSDSALTASGWPEALVI